MHEFMTHPIQSLIWLHPGVGPQACPGKEAKIRAWQERMRHLRPYVGQFFDPALIHFLVSDLPENMPLEIKTIAQQEWIQYLFGRTRKQLGLDSNAPYTEDALNNAVSPLAFHLVALDTREGGEPAVPSSQLHDDDGGVWGSGNSWKCCSEEGSLGLRIYRFGVDSRL